MHSSCLLQAGNFVTLAVRPAKACVKALDSSVGREAQEYPARVAMGSPWLTLRRDSSYQLPKPHFAGARR